MIAATQAPALLRERKLTAQGRESVLKPYLPSLSPPTTPRFSSPSASASSSRRSSISSTASSSSHKQTTPTSSSSAPSSSPKHQTASSNAKSTTTAKATRDGQQKSSWRRRRRSVIRPLLASFLHLAVSILIHAIFSCYVRLRCAYHAVFGRATALLYYHHRSPQLMMRDIAGLGRRPEHVAVVLTLGSGGVAGRRGGRTRRSGEDGEGIERVLGEIGEIAAWASCAGVKTLSMYEKSEIQSKMADRDMNQGILKSHLSIVHHTIKTTLTSYYGSESPAVTVHAPHKQSFPQQLQQPAPSTATATLHIHLLSHTDSLPTLTDLTKTLTTLVQSSKLSPEQITPSLLSTELDEALGCGEPDLLVLFGPRVELEGYPCWQLRLTEIFHAQDNEGVEYQVWLRALYRYSKVEMRFGR